MQTVLTAPSRHVKAVTVESVGQPDAGDSPYIMYSNTLQNLADVSLSLSTYLVSLGRRCTVWGNQVRCSFSHSLDTPAGPEMTLIITERCPMRPQ